MIGIIPKTLKKTPQWQNFAFYISCALLAVVILGYAALFYFEAKAFGVLQDLEEKIAQVATKEEKVTEAKVLSAQKKISDFSKLLKNHQKSSNFFTFLEENCHPKVWLTEVALNPEKAEALVSGKTADFETLGQQLFIFQQHELIQSVDLTNLLIGKKGETEFSFYLYLNPKIFQ